MPCGSSVVGSTGPRTVSLTPPFASCLVLFRVRDMAAAPNPDPPGLGAALWRTVADDISKSKYVCSLKAIPRQRTKSELWKKSINN